ncbi:hypothetical protein ACRQ5Q_16730 [Bradyrhizobium sp. PMVTL-01]|uniref:hypothetical protein n=1 Tax=Bradyrhizobium sp. PMVTL-01 TaxID=3434999 RepID=UPI003F72F5AA
MTREEMKTRQALEQKMAATLVYEARLKEYEAARWLGLSGQIEGAAANVHSALDGVLDATAAQIDALRKQPGGVAMTVSAPDVQIIGASREQAMAKFKSMAVTERARLR